MNEIKDMLAKMPKWGWVAIGGGFLLVVFLSRGNQQTTYTDTPNYAPGVMSDSKVSESEMAQRIGNLVQELSANFNERYQEQNEMFTERQFELSEQMKAYQESFNERIQALTSQANNVARPSYSYSGGGGGSSTPVQPSPIVVTSAPKPMNGAYGIDNKTLQEISRKAMNNIPLTGNNPTHKAVYDQYQAYVKSEAQKKAVTGQQLSNPTNYTQGIYNQTVTLLS